MIHLLTLCDEPITVSRGRYTGRTSRCRVLIGVDFYNIVLAEGAGEEPPGKRFVSTLTQFAKMLEEWTDIDREVVRQQLSTLLCRLFGGEQTDRLTWGEMDKRFLISQREKGSSGRLSLYRRLKEAGLEGKISADEEESVEEEEAA